MLHCNTKNMKTEKVIIEVSTDGLYSAYMPSDETEKEAIDDFYAAVSEMKELEEADGRTFPDLQFQFEHAVVYATPKTVTGCVAEDPAGYNEKEQ